VKCKLNPSNRRVRTRTHGGVTGKAREGLPMSIKSSPYPVWTGLGACGHAGAL